MTADSGRACELLHRSTGRRCGLPAERWIASMGRCLPVCLPHSEQLLGFIILDSEEACAYEVMEL